MAPRKDFAKAALAEDKQVEVDKEEAQEVAAAAPVIDAVTAAALENPDLKVLKPGVIVRTNKPQLGNRNVSFIGAHPSNTPGVKWLYDLDGNALNFDWKPCEDERFGKGAEYAVKTGFKDGGGRARDGYVVRTIREIQLWLVDI